MFKSTKNFHNFSAFLGSSWIILYRSVTLSGSFQVSVEKFLMQALYYLQFLSIWSMQNMYEVLLDLTDIAFFTNDQWQLIILDQMERSMVGNLIDCIKIACCFSCCLGSLCLTIHNKGKYKVARDICTQGLRFYFFLKFSAG